MISTSFPKSFDYVKSLGASQVFDYNSPSVTEELVSAFKGKDCAGAVAIASVDLDARNSAAEACTEVVGRSEGTKFAALAMPPPPNIYPGVEAKFANAVNLHQERGFGFAIFSEWLPKALAEGKFRPAPDPAAVGNGLESLQTGMDILRDQGASAKKFVVSL